MLCSSCSGDGKFICNYCGGDGAHYGRYKAVISLENHTPDIEISMPPFFMKNYPDLLDYGGAQRGAVTLESRGMEAASTTTFHAPYLIARCADDESAYMVMCSPEHPPVCSDQYLNKVISALLESLREADIETLTNCLLGREFLFQSVGRVDANNLTRKFGIDTNELNSALHQFRLKDPKAAGFINALLA